MAKTVFITGSSGFIGSNLAKRILTTEPDTKVIGLDNMNDYYDVRIKEARLAELQKFENYTFIKGNLADKALINSILPPDADDGTIPGGDPQGGAAAQGAGQARALHAEALADDHSRDLPQGEERGQAFAALQKHRPARCGARIGPAARLRDRPLARAVRRLERLHDRRESPGDADRPPGHRPRQNLQRTGQAAALATGRNEENHRRTHRTEHRHLEGFQ